MTREEALQFIVGLVKVAIAINYDISTQDLLVATAREAFRAIGVGDRELDRALDALRARDAL